METGFAEDHRELFQQPSYSWISVDGRYFCYFLYWTWVGRWKSPYIFDPVGLKGSATVKDPVGEIKGREIK